MWVAERGSPHHKHTNQSADGSGSSSARSPRSSTPTRSPLPQTFVEYVMSPFTYNTITAALAVGVVMLFVVMLFSLIALIMCWKTPKRRGHVARFLVSLAAIPCLLGLQQAILWLVFLPSLGRQQMAATNAAREKRLAESSLVSVGDRVPQFSLTTVDGDEISVPDGGNVVVIVFFATWCGPCRMELPHIERIWAANKRHEHFRLLVIGREESAETVRSFRDKQGFSFPVAADPDRAVYSLFAKELIPRTLVVAPDGRIVY
ncbi:MAG: TlpA family protein disulfide reductase [Planctomycetota bacterium]|nr:MAG: TlpA family protein disulfide reductase [Planctomycetota bacterium]